MVGLFTDWRFGIRERTRRIAAKPSSGLAAESRETFRGTDWWARYSAGPPRC
jgi:hypothetical protein